GTVYTAISVDNAVTWSPVNISSGYPYNDCPCDFSADGSHWVTVWWAGNSLTSQYFVVFSSSSDGGRTWSAVNTIAGPSNVVGDLVIANNHNGIKFGVEF